MSKRVWAILIKRALLSVVTVFLLGVAYDYFTTNPEYRRPFTSGGIAVVLCGLVLILLGLVNLVSGALYLWLFAAKDFTEAVLDDLRGAELRSPRANEPKTYMFLVELVGDDSSRIDDRLKAATLLGNYDAAMQRGIFHSLALRKAIDTAVLQYSLEAPNE